MVLESLSEAFSQGATIKSPLSWTEQLPYLFFLFLFSVNVYNTSLSFPPFSLCISMSVYIYLLTFKISHFLPGNIEEWKTQSNCSFNELWIILREISISFSLLIPSPIFMISSFSLSCGFSATSFFPTSESPCLTNCFVLSVCLFVSLLWRTSHHLVSYHLYLIEWLKGHSIQLQRKSALCPLHWCECPFSVCYEGPWTHNRL